MKETPIEHFKRKQRKHRTGTDAEADSASWSLVNVVIPKFVSAEHSAHGALGGRKRGKLGDKKITLYALFDLLEVDGGAEFARGLISARGSEAIEELNGFADLPMTISEPDTVNRTLEFEHKQTKKLEYLRFDTASEYVRKWKQWQREHEE